MSHIAPQLRRHRRRDARRTTPKLSRLARLSPLGARAASISTSLTAVVASAVSTSCPMALPFSLMQERLRQARPRWRAQRPNDKVRPYMVYAKYIKHFLPAGRKAIDYCLATHLHTDHIGSASCATETAAAGYLKSGILSLYDEVPYKSK